MPVEIFIIGLTGINTTFVITRLTAHFLWGLISDLVICKHGKVWSYMTQNVLTEKDQHNNTMQSPG